MARLLPFVTEKAIAALQEEIKTKDKNSYVTSVLERLKLENACVPSFISKFALRCTDPTESATMAVLLYRLLEIQAAEDKKLRRNQQGGGYREHGRF